MEKYKNKVKAIFLLSLVHVSVIGTDVAEIRDSILRNNLSVKSVKEDVEIASISKRGAYMNMFSPTLVGQALGRENWNNTEAITTVKKSKVAQYGAKLSYSIFSGGRDWASVNISKANENLAGLGLRETTIKVITRSLNSYNTIFRFQQKKSALYREVEYMKKTLEIVQARFELGETTKTEVLRIKSSISQLEYQLAELDAQIAGLSAEFENQTFLDTKNIDFSKPLVLESEYIPENLKAFISSANESSISLQVAKYNLEASDHKVDQSFSSLLPQISVSAETNVIHNNNIKGGLALGKSNYKTNSISAECSIPILARGDNYSQYFSSKREKMKRKLALESSKRNLREEAIKLWKQYKANEVELKSVLKSIEHAKETLDATYEEVRLGTKFILHLLNASKTFFDAQAAYVDAFSKRSSYILRMYELLGITDTMTFNASSKETEEFEKRIEEWNKESSSSEKKKIWSKNSPSSKKKSIIEKYRRNKLLKAKQDEGQSL